MAIRYLYVGIIQLTFSLTVLSLFFRKYRKTRSSMQNKVSIFLIFTLLVFSCLYGVISNSWGFIASPWLYGMIAQILFVTFIILESYWLLRTILSKSFANTSSKGERISLNL